MESLIAYMNGERVGELIKLTNGAHQFQYDKNWMKANGEDHCHYHSRYNIPN